MYLMQTGVISEPTLTVSPWFEARRLSYMDYLLGVSTQNDWDSYVYFFAQGIEASATSTLRRIKELSRIQNDLQSKLTQHGLRAESAHQLIEFAISQITFTAKQAAAELNVSYQRANKLAAQLIDLGILEVLHNDSYRRKYFVPEVLEVVLN
jgi:Fic family protein